MGSKFRVRSRALSGVDVLSGRRRLCRNRQAASGWKRLQRLLAILAVVTLGWGCQAGPAAEPSASDPTEAAEIAATLLKVVDGDTIEVAFENRVERVRYIGVDTPESGDRCAAEATDANRRMVEGKQLLLVRDAENRDRYGRLLRYVYAGDTFVNLKLVEFGLAGPLRIRPNDRHAETIAAAARAARRDGTGCLWDPIALAKKQAETAAATPTPTPARRVMVERFHYDAAGPDADNLNDEYVVLINLGEPVDVSGWTVTDTSSHSYRFSSYVWQTGTRITLHSGSGQDGDGRFYWGLGTPVWNNREDELALKDGEGNWVLSYGYGR